MRAENSHVDTGRGMMEEGAFTPHRVTDGLVRHLGSAESPVPLLASALLGTGEIAARAHIVVFVTEGLAAGRHARDAMNAPRLAGRFR